MAEVIHLADYAAQRTSYIEAVREAAEAIETWSCLCVGMALALNDVREPSAAPVGKVVFDPQAELAGSTDRRVHELLELSSVLQAAAEAIGTSGE